MNKKLVTKELTQISNEIRRLNRAIDAAPRGKLICVVNGKYAKFFNSVNGKSEYIPKSKREFAATLAQKKYNVLLRDYYAKEQQALERYLSSRGHKEEADLDEFLASPAIGRLLANKLLLPPPKDTDSQVDSLTDELRQWADEPFENNPIFPGGLTVRTPSGRLVRSKSESAIETALLRHGIPFRYESPLQLEGENYYPDFTLRHPMTGKFIYWEHFGKMDDPAYVQRTIYKLQTYIRNGIIPGINLIITSETEDSPLDEFFVDSIIKAWFT